MSPACTLIVRPGSVARRGAPRQPGGSPEARLGRLEVAVEVVDAEQAQLHDAGRRAGVSGRRVGACVEPEQGHASAAAKAAMPGGEVAGVPQAKRLSDHVPPVRSDGSTSSSQPTAGGPPVLLSALIRRVKRRERPATKRPGNLIDRAGPGRPSEPPARCEEKYIRPPDGSKSRP